MPAKPAHDHDEDEDQAAGQRGRPDKAIRWTVEHAATEFGIDRRTLAKRIRETNAARGDDCRFSTLQICDAVFKESPRDLKDRQHAELLRVQTENAKRERIPIGIVLALWDAALQAFAAVLKAAKGKVLTAEKINELLGKLRSVELPTKW